MQIVIELFAFLKYRKNLWLWPLLTILVLLGLLVVFAQSSALAPFIYSLF